jgi:hypothetical protein
MNTKIEPSHGAMKAARAIMEKYDPACFAADYNAEDEQRAIAEIIDRETKPEDIADVIGSA